MTDAPRQPYSLDLEQALLGAILVNNEAYHVVSGYLFPKHFYEGIHQTIFRALSQMIGRGERATPKTLIAALGDFTAKTADGNDFNVRGYVARLAAEATTIVNAGDFGRGILNLWAERQIIAATQRMAERMGGPERPQVTEQIEAAEADLIAIRKALGAAGGDGGRQVSDAVQELIERAEAVRDGARPVTSSGFKDVDYRIVGYMDGRLGIVAGRPGMGKTVWMTESARRVAMRSQIDGRREEERIAVAFVSLEIDMPELTARLVAGASFDSWKVAYKDLVAANYSEEHGGLSADGAIAWLKQVRDRLAGYPLYLEHAPGASVVEIAGRLRIIKERARRAGYRLGVAFVDYLGLVKVSERYRGQKVNELGEVVLDLKHLAQDEDVQMVLGSQLSRSVENREDKRPQLSDLRDSGNIEEHADWVGMLYREAYYLQSKANQTLEDTEKLAIVQNDMDMDVAKARLGKPGITNLYVDVGCSFVSDKSRYG